MSIDADWLGRLRAEILQSQRVNSDLMRWKLLIVAALGAAGLGFTGSNAVPNADLLLAAIPPACVYVDLLCRHGSLRMLVAGRFIDSRREVAGVDGHYEQYVERVRRKTINQPKVSVPTSGRKVPLRVLGHDPFALEGAALAASTVALSLALVCFAAYARPPFWAILVASGLIGVVLTPLMARAFRTRYALVNDVLEELAATMRGDGPPQGELQPAVPRPTAPLRPGTAPSSWGGVGRRRR